MGMTRYIACIRFNSRGYFCFWFYSSWRARKLVNGACIYLLSYLVTSPDTWNYWSLGNHICFRREYWTTRIFYSKRNPQRYVRGTCVQAQSNTPLRREESYMFAPCCICVSHDRGIKDESLEETHGIYIQNKTKQLNQFNLIAMNFSNN